MPGELSMLQLYRQILKAAREFPSVKKNAIIREIKAEFRANQSLADSGKIAHCRELAERGLSDLSAYRAAAVSGDPSINLKGATQ